MRKRIPTQIGHKLQKGILAYKDIKNGGCTVMVVWLSKPYETGKEFEISDIKSVDATLHFCDVESLEQTVDVLSGILKDLKKGEVDESD